MLRQRFVLDTSALTDSATREREGYKTLCDGVNCIMDIIAEARLSFAIKTEGTPCRGAGKAVPLIVKTRGHLPGRPRPKGVPALTLCSLDFSTSLSTRCLPKF